nr:hypothetical protein BgiMline_023626 [Biomphalaria glabrata]
MYLLLALDACRYRGMLVVTFQMFGLRYRGTSHRRRPVCLLLLFLTWSTLGQCQRYEEESRRSEGHASYDQPPRRTRRPPLASDPSITDEGLLNTFPGLFQTSNQIVDQTIQMGATGARLPLASYHGCCSSEPKMDTYSTLSDPLGTAVSLVQVGQRSQYFPSETCRREINCSACSCSCTMVNQTLTALVYKPGSTREIMFSLVRVPTFCRCMNNLAIP